MNSTARRVVGIYGPTGSGKTDLAVHVARLLGTEVVNCDPAQCYDGLPVLTNKPGSEHDAVAAHRLVGVWPLAHNASVATFADEAHAEIDALLAEHGAAVACGGSGLYLRAALCQLQWGAAGEPALAARRTHLEAEYDRVGPQRMHERLAHADPPAAERIHPHDRKRVVRALEVHEAAGSVAPDGASIWAAPYRHPATTVFGLVVDRAANRRAIDRRTHAMFARGVLAEVAGVIGDRAQFIDRLSSTARKLHGLEDCAAILRGEVDPEEGMARMAARTRQYAKRQDTWRRRWPSLAELAIDLRAFDAPATGRLLVDRLEKDAEMRRS